MKEKGKTALLEIGVEELPARFIDPGREQLAELARKELLEAGLIYSELCVFGSPRRLALIIKGLPVKAHDREDVVIGPPPATAKDDNGNWTAAALGFAKAQRVPVTSLKFQQTAKGERLVAVHQVKGLATAHVLKILFPRLISQLHFPKSMIWSDPNIRFARPIRWIVAMFQTTPIRFRYAGIASDKTTFGLLALGAKKIPLNKPEDYCDLLRNRCIMVNADDRRQKIVSQLDSLPKKIKHGLKAIAPEEHIEEVVNLTEYPVGIRGQFQEAFLSLPKEILISVLRKHQKFFPIENSSHELTHHFIGVRNGPSDFQEGVKEGYERVTNARLADAHFFVEHDKRVPLETMVPRLAGVSFIENVGTMLDKTERVTNASRQMAQELGLGKDTLNDIISAARLSKADLLTHIVGELPELQGVAGRIYMTNSGNIKVAEAIEQHYWPLTADGPLPNSLEGAIIAVADKMDTLAANFASGIIPSGSQDPFGLRRASIGVIRILIDRNWPFAISQLIAEAFKNLPEKLAGEKDAQQKCATFICQRMSAWLANQGYKSDEIESVVSASGAPAVIASKLRDLKNVRNRPEFAALSGAIKRAGNIIKQAEEMKILPLAEEPVTCDAADPAEKRLMEALETAAPKVAAAVERGEYATALVELSELKNPVDAFFEEIMVMVDDENIRARRLSILCRVKRLFDSVADFSKLQPSSNVPK